MFGLQAKADGEMGDAAMKPPAPVPLKKPVIRPPGNSSMGLYSYFFSGILKSVLVDCMKQ